MDVVKSPGYRNTKAGFTFFLNELHAALEKPEQNEELRGNIWQPLDTKLNRLLTSMSDHEHDDRT